MMFLLQRMRYLYRQESAQALLMFAILLPVIVISCAVAVDIGVLRAQKAKLQSAADAAALAAALAIPRCDGVLDCSLMQTAAQDAMTNNGYANATLKIQCNAASGSGVTITLNNGPCAIASDPNYGVAQYAEVELTEYQPTFFARAFNIDSEEISARAEAKSIPFCMIFSADNTTSSAPPGVNFDLVSLGANISANCGLADDSGASNAMNAQLVSLFTSVDTEQTVVHGGISDGLLSSISFSPAPQTYAPVVDDPLSYLTPPSPGTCMNGGLDIVLLGTYTLQPGTYCGPVIIASVLAKVVFAPGVYYFKADSAGQSGLDIIGATSVSGNGITFYFDSGSLTMGGLVPTNLVAPTTGTYAGILLYQNPADTTPMTLLGDTGSVFQGAIYAAGAPLTVLGVNDAAYTIIDTGSLHEEADVGLLSSILSILNGETFHVNADYSSLPYGSPVKVGSSILVE